MKVKLSEGTEGRENYIYVKLTEEDIEKIKDGWNRLKYILINGSKYVVSVGKGK